MPLRAHIAALVLAVACGPALAADLIGYGEAFDTLYRVDLTTQSALEIGRATPLGFPRLANIVGLTFSPDGQRLFAVSDANSVKSLLQINQNTGLATIVGSLNLGTSQQLDLGLAFTCDGNLWMSAGSGRFWQVNPGDATVTEIGNLGVKVTGLAAQGNVLYGTGSQGNNNLYRIDQSNAQATLVGAYGSGASYISTASPAFDNNGQLWVVLDYIPLPGAQWSDLAQVNTGSGTLTNLGSITAQGSSLNDLAFIGLRGLAITPSACLASRPVSDPAPTLSWIGMTGMITLLTLIAGTRLGRRRPNV
jgi:hypothetical protein